MKQLIIIILLFVCFQSKAQTGIRFFMPSDSSAFEIRNNDSRGREIGYFKYNQITNRFTIRGNIKPSMNFFVTKFFLPNWEIFQAQQKVIEQMNWDGTIKDLDAWKNAIGEYRRLKVKYGM